MRTWRVRAATRELERVVRSDSTRYDAWVKLVECYSHPLVCREDDARAAWERARTNVPSERDTLFLAGLRELHLNADYGAAIGQFTSAIRAETGMVGSRDTRFNLALSSYLAGQIDEAEGFLKPLLESEENGARELELKIRVLVARDDLGGASARARDLARAFAQEPYPYVLLAQIEMLRDAQGAAEEFCNSALVIAPRYIPAIVTRAHLYTADGRHSAAQVSFEKLLLFDDPIVHAIGEDGIAFVDFLTGDFGHGRAALDEAIRHANMAGSVRRALSYASKLVTYLCELGQVDQAQEVMESWIGGMGEVPERVGRVRIDLLRGDVEAARRALVEIKSDKDALVWSRVLAVDDIELTALAHVATGDYDKALTLLAGSDGIGAVVGRRSFVEGFAAFESGDAEAARSAFELARRLLFGVEFPYRGDPVLNVQSRFFIAESAIASGDESTARAHYAEFLEYWGNESWGLPAVERARGKLASLTPATESP